MTSKKKKSLTSKESSYPAKNLSWVAKLHRVPAITPNTTDAAGWDEKYELCGLAWKKGHPRAPTKPDPGVMATRPAIAPEQNPTADHFFSMR